MGYALGMAYDRIWNHLHMRYSKLYCKAFGNAMFKAFYDRKAEKGLFGYVSLAESDRRKGTVQIRLCLKNGGYTPRIATFHR